MTSCTFKGVHFAVEHRTALLDSTVVTASDDSIAMDEDGADRDPSFGQTQSRLGNGGVKECAHAD